MKSLITITRSLQFSRVLTAFIAVAAAAPSAYAIITPNLVTDPGFESNPIYAPFTDILGPPYVQNQWGEEMSTIVTGPNAGVTPIGARMLRMANSGGAATQAFQLIDVSAYSAAINLGTATVTGSAFYNAPTTIPAAGVGVSVSFFDSSNVALFPPFASGGLPALDNNTSTWEQRSVTGLVPVNTAFMLMQVAYSNITIGNSPGFVDETSMTLRLVPEPTSIALGGIALAGALFLRKRR